MKYFKQLISAVTLLILASAASTHAEEISGNVVGGTWSGTVTNTTVVPGEGSHNQSSGPTPIYNPNINSITFSYSQSTVNQIIGINTALANSGSGLQVSGINYSWQYYNQDWNRGTLSAGISVTNSAGQVIYNYGHTLPQTTQGWTAFSASQTFNNSYNLTDLGNLNISFTGRDDRFWGGYYGPMVRDVDARFRYTVDPCVSNPQSSPTCNGYRIYYEMWDDGYAQVDLPFTFPYYGFTFNRAYMFTNGVVGFLNPNLAPGGYCCDGVDLHSQRFVQGSPWNFAIYALNTDLYPGPNSTFYSETTQNGSGIRIKWDRVVEIGTNNENTFSVELRNTGDIGLNYEQVNLSAWRNPTIGIAGDTYQGTYSQFYHGPAWTMPDLTGTTITYSGNETTDICSINPLYNSSCPGYAEAFLQLQCSMNTLYNSSCPGYAEAFFNQQCSLNALYDISCPGYAVAYYDYQCVVDPLYHTGCTGYTDAFFTQQCSLNTLYNEACPGYALAFFNQQCALNPLYNEQCEGYEDAFYVQQCTANPLYDSGCTGYEEAYFTQQCSLNTLYSSDCPGYELAYFDQQCNLNGLYDKNCPNYQQASCESNGIDKWVSNPGVCILVSQPATADSKLATDTSIVQEPVTITSAVTIEESATVATAIQEKTVVAQVETKEAAVTTSPAAEATAPVSLTSSSSSATATAQAAAPAPARTAAPAARTAPTTRQALAEQRMAAAREAAAQSARENPSETAAAMDSAESMEQQVEVQNAVLGAMSFVPGFDAYGRATLPDAAGYRPFEIYPGQRNVDTPAARGLLGRSDRIHQEMVDAQYK